MFLQSVSMETLFRLFLYLWARKDACLIRKTTAFLKMFYQTENASKKEKKFYEIATGKNNFGRKFGMKNNRVRNWLVEIHKNIAQKLIIKIQKSNSKINYY